MEGGGRKEGRRREEGERGRVAEGDEKRGGRGYLLSEHPSEDNIQRTSH